MSPDVASTPPIEDKAQGLPLLVAEALVQLERLVAELERGRVVAEDLVRGGEEVEHPGSALHVVQAREPLERFVGQLERSSRLTAERAKDRSRPRRHCEAQTVVRLGRGDARALRPAAPPAPDPETADSRGVPERVEPSGIGRLERSAGFQASLQLLAIEILEHRGTKSATHEGGNGGYLSNERAASSSSTARDGGRNDHLQKVLRCLLGLGVDRQRDRDCRPLALGASDRDFTAHFYDVTLARREPEPHAHAAGLHR